jgi:gluconolactonase
MNLVHCSTIVLVALLVAASTQAVSLDTRALRPDATVDLRTDEGAALIKGQWKYADAHVVEVDHRGPGPDLKPSGEPLRTHDVEPKAGAADFDDSSWQSVPATSLEARRGTGRLSFNWYRINVTIPSRLASFDPTGATVVFEIVVDDYAELYVDGKLPQVLGTAGGPLVRGYNAPNQVVLTRDARPGQKFQIAVFGMNGPISSPPSNFIWIRSATIDFYKPGRLRTGEPVVTEIIRFDPALDSIIAPDTKIEKLADGFGFTEGPVWVSGPDGQDGHLLFSDPNNNTIYRWSTDGQVSVFRSHSGYTGADIGEYGQPGSNGLTLDPQGRLTIAEHGNRRVTRLEKNGHITVLADRFEGKRLNSPNDLVYRSDGALFFTDPPFGLPNFHDDTRRELPHTGVYVLIDGNLKLVSIDLKGPNGIAFSPDEKFLYVANWDVRSKVVMRYEVAPDGTLSDSSVFADLTSFPGDEALDGLKVDRAGNVFVSGPGGVWIYASSGKKLGLLKVPQLPANFAWGEDDGRTLFLCGRNGLYSIRTRTAGALHGPRDR